MNIDTTTMFLKKKEGENDDEPDPHVIDAMDECSTPIETKVIIDIVALEKQEATDRQRAIEEYVRPLYRSRSAADIHQDVSEYRTWVDNATLTEASCKSWIPSTADAFAVTVKNNEPVSGFGITGIDLVTFAYDMDEAHAEATVNKKYLYRRKPKGNLWQPKHSKSRFQRDNHSITDHKCF
jgi:hypothetical protein